MVQSNSWIRGLAESLVFSLSLSLSFFGHCNVAL